MDPSMSRRRFLKTTALGASVLTAAEGSILATLPAVTATEARLDRDLVRLQSDIEPLVRLLEETPRERVVEEFATRVRKGLSYREVLAALLLAGVRNVQPRPYVGFKFHAVLVVNSAHLASLDSPDEERWLPIFWSLDYFKRSQAEEAETSGWRMRPVREQAIPPASRARQAFIDAMDRWDEEAADVAVAGLARSAGAHELFELFCRYGARDFRDIGHKAIFVANSWRTLQCIGWRFAEPVLRSLAYALLKYDGANPARADHLADRPWRRHQELVRRIRKRWLEGKPSPDATAELLNTLRKGSYRDVCDQAVELINRGVAVQSIWDACHTAAVELVMRQPAIIPLHAVTSTNALRYAFEHSANDETRRMLLLQNLAFLTLFRDRMPERGSVAQRRIDELKPASKGNDAPTELSAIFDAVGRDRMAAAERALAFLDHGSPRELVRAARLLIFAKGTDSHDYKYSSAALEDYALVSPPWRKRFLAASTFLLRGSHDRDNRLIHRIRTALRA